MKILGPVWYDVLAVYRHCRLAHCYQEPRRGAVNEAVVLVTRALTVSRVYRRQASGTECSCKCSHAQRIRSTTEWTVPWLWTITNAFFFFCFEGFNMAKFHYPQGVVLGFLAAMFVTLAFSQSLNGMQSYTPVIDPASNTTFCALDQPSAVVPLVDVSVGIPVGVPDAVVCGFCCTGRRGCVSYNYRQSQSTPAQCELFNTPPRNCSALKSDSGQCQHYEVGLNFVSLNATWLYSRHLLQLTNVFGGCNCMDVQTAENNKKKTTIRGSVINRKG
jgi:hypothetical protein